MSFCVHLFTVQLFASTREGLVRLLKTSCRPPSVSPDNYVSDVSYYTSVRSQWKKWLLWSTYFIGSGFHVLERHRVTQFWRRPFGGESRTCVMVFLYYQVPFSLSFSLYSSLFLFLTVPDHMDTTPTHGTRGLLTCNYSVASILSIYLHE